MPVGNALQERCPVYVSYTHGIRRLQNNQPRVGGSNQKYKRKESTYTTFCVVRVVYCSFFCVVYYVYV